MDASTSSLSSVNSQLLSHGHAKRPLSLEGLSERDQAEVLGVLLDLLSNSTVSGKGKSSMAYTTSPNRF